VPNIAEKLWVPVIGDWLPPSKSGLMNKHIVKHIVGALCPSESGLMNKHINVAKCYRAKHIVKHIVLKMFSLILGVLFSSKSGLMNKYTVKHTVSKYIVKTYRETYRVWDLSNIP
jgi:hypothetical protein